MKLVAVERLASEGESETLELKKTTAELVTAMRTLCAFPNGRGGRIIFGVTLGGKVRGQDVSDGTQQEVAAALQKLEPPATVDLQVLPVEGSARSLIVLEAEPSMEALPYTYDGKPYRRIGTTTSLMPQDHYH